MTPEIPGVEFDKSTIDGRRLAISRTDHRMEREGKRVHTRNGKGKKATLSPRQIQEYDFFVTQDGGENRETTEEVRPARTKKKRGRNRSTALFFSD